MGRSDPVPVTGETVVGHDRLLIELPVRCHTQTDLRRGEACAYGCEVRTQVAVEAIVRQRQLVADDAVAALSVLGYPGAGLRIAFDACQWELDAVPDDRERRAICDRTGRGAQQCEDQRDPRASWPSAAP